MNMYSHLDTLNWAERGEVVVGETSVTDQVHQNLLNETAQR